MTDETPQSRGGKNRAKNLSKERKSEIARNGALARWSAAASIPRAEFSSSDTPLRIGEFELDCFVLDNATRVISQRGMFRGLGITRGGARDDMKSDETGAELPRFATQNWLNPHLSNDLMMALRNPISFSAPRFARVLGYSATILPDICEAILAAQIAGDTTPRQEAIVKRAKSLIGAFAKVGIIALVDEATGYQDKRAKDDLQKILAAYISPSLLPWHERFPVDFFKEMFRVWGWPWPANEGAYKGPLGPRYAGKLIKQIVLENLPPGVLEELERKNPPNEKWQRKKRVGQLLTSEIGHPHVDKLVANMTMLFRLSDNKKDFWRHYERAFKKPSPQGELFHN